MEIPWSGSEWKGVWVWGTSGALVRYFFWIWVLVKHVCSLVNILWAVWLWYVLLCIPLKYVSFNKGNRTKPQMDILWSQIHNKLMVLNKSPKEISCLLQAFWLFLAGDTLSSIRFFSGKVWKAPLLSRMVGEVLRCHTGKSSTAQLNFVSECPHPRLWQPILLSFKNKKAKALTKNLY